MLDRQLLSESDRHAADSGSGAASRQWPSIYIYSNSRGGGQLRMRRRLYDDDSSTFRRAGGPPAGLILPNYRPPTVAEPYGDRTLVYWAAAAAQHRITSKLIRHFMASKHRVSVKRRCMHGSPAMPCRVYPPTYPVPVCRQGGHAPARYSLPAGDTTFVAGTVHSRSVQTGRPSLSPVVYTPTRRMARISTSLLRFHFFVRVCLSAVRRRFVSHTPDKCYLCDSWQQPIPQCVLCCRWQ